MMTNKRGRVRGRGRSVEMADVEPDWFFVGISCAVIFQFQMAACK